MHSSPGNKEVKTATSLSFFCSTLSPEWLRGCRHSTSSEKKAPFLIRVLSCFQEWDNTFFYYPEQAHWTLALNLRNKDADSWPDILEIQRRNTLGPKGSIPLAQSRAQAQHRILQPQEQRTSAMLSFLISSSLSFSQTPSLLGSIRSTLG